MEWLETTKLITDLGFCVVAAGFVMWQIYKHITHRQKVEEDEHENTKTKQAQENHVAELRNERYERMLDDLQMKQDSFYNLLIENNRKMEERYDSMIKQLLDAINQPHILSDEENERMTKIDEEIDGYLERTLQVCKATRVFLVKYHNGGNDMLGNSILKMSMSNEKCAAGIAHVQRNFQNQIRSFSTLLVKELNEKGICFIEDIENIKNIDNSIYQYLKQIGIKAKYAIAITNIKTNCVIGYMSIDFANNEHIDIEQVKHCLKDKKLKIEALLNLQ